ncbi:MAG: single-stranded DNA-binding protein [Novosphingobium sp.]|nr:single-stranded DNA-binding protein [Novosphingobium sp.]
MAAQLACYGRLGADPVRRTSQSGKDWATASLAVDLGNEEGAPPQWFNVVAFGRVAETLCRHNKGDLVSVSGRLQLNRWQDRDGKDHERMQVIADAVISARSVRPGGRRASDAGQRHG